LTGEEVDTALKPLRSKRSNVSDDLWSH
jgi:hypothetical protein